MKKLYEKNELTFSIMWIVVYCVLQSLANPLNKVIGIEYAASAVFCILQTIVLFNFIRKNKLQERYGLCKSSVPASRFLYYVPLIILATGNLWNGAAVNYSLPETVCRIACMCGILRGSDLQRLPVCLYCKRKCEIGNYYFQCDLWRRTFDQSIQWQRYGTGKQSVPDLLCDCGRIPACHDFLSRWKPAALHNCSLCNQYARYFCK